MRYLNVQGIKLDHLFMFVTGTVGEVIKYTDNNKQEREVLDENGNGISHVGYFKKRIEDIVADNETNYAEVAFNEKNTPAKSLDCIMDMAESIQTYIEQFPDDTQITLHADFTGGLRHANMMMMSVLRIMQYNGVKIGKVLYSNFNRKIVEEAAPIYELFDFVSGAEEFANFGSANAINHYFKHKEKPKVLADLLVAMDVFSEEIRLCHRKGLMKAAVNLKKSIDIFEEADEKDINVRLIRQLKARIKKDYSSLLEADFSILNLIKWCLEHDYLQQALTLYVEGVPDYLYEKRFFQLSDDPEKRSIIDERKKENEEYTDGFFQLVVFDGKYKFKDENGKTVSKIYAPVAEMNKINDEKEKELLSAVKEITPEKHDKSVAINVERLRELIEDFNKKQYLCLKKSSKLLEIYTALEAWRQAPALLKNPDADDALYRFFDEKLDLGDDYGIKKYNKIVTYLRNMSYYEKKNFLTDAQVEYAFRFMSYCEPEQNYFKLNIPTESMRHMLNSYGFFKSERNASNHARMDEDVITANELKEKMTKAVDYIIEVENEVSL